MVRPLVLITDSLAVTLLHHLALSLRVYSCLLNGIFLQTRLTVVCKLAGRLYVSSLSRHQHCDPS